MHFWTKQKAVDAQDPRRVGSSAIRFASAVLKDRAKTLSLPEVSSQLDLDFWGGGLRMQADLWTPKLKHLPKSCCLYSLSS